MMIKTLKFGLFYSWFILLSIFLFWKVYIFYWEAYEENSRVETMSPYAQKITQINQKIQSLQSELVYDSPILTELRESRETLRSSNKLFFEKAHADYDYRYKKGGFVPNLVDVFKNNEFELIKMFVLFNVFFFLVVLVVFKFKGKNKRG